MRTNIEVIYCVVFLLCRPWKSIQTVTQPNFHISRRLLKTGFHRDVHTEVSVEAVPHGCQYVLEETLPAGCFVDIYQLQQMQEFEGPEVWTESVIDLEKPEYLSSPHLVYIYLKQIDGRISRVTLPVHLRYHRPSAYSEFAQVRIPQPRLLSVCTEADHVERGSVKVPCSRSSETLCHWAEVPYSKSDEELVMQVPVGQTHHQVPVVLLTLVASLAGCAWLCVTIINKPDTVVAHKTL